MSYRPITDVWILARAKLKDGKKYYGAYPGGFLERARALLGVTINDSLLHVCGGLARYYPYRRGFGPNDCTVDLDPTTEPTYLMDVRLGLAGTLMSWKAWPAILIDPPYTLDDADKYKPGRKLFPGPNKLVEDAINAVRPGGRVGLLHYIVPRCPPNAVFVACIAVIVGFNNRVRVYSVFEREM